MFRSPLSRNPAAGRTTKSARRRRRRLTLVLSLFVITASASLPFIGAGAAQEEEGEKSGLRARMPQATDKGKANIIAGAEFVPGEVLVRFHNETSAKGAEVAAMSLRPEDGGEINARIENFEGSDIVRGLRLARVDPARTIEAARELARRPDVLYAEPNYIWRATATPNDPRYTSGEMYGLNKINAPAAWDITQGSDDVVVGVLDGGVDVNHPDLQENIWRNSLEATGVTGNDDDGNGYIDDVNGWDFSTCTQQTPPNTICGNSSVFDNQVGDDHATHVAGTIGARGNNNVGVTGVNWRVKIMSLKVLGPTGGSTTNIIRGYNYALQMRQRGVNLRVLNNSYGGPGKMFSALEAILALNDAGILFVVAAGNGGDDSIGDDNFNIPDFPSNYDSPNVIAVASTTSADNLSTSSNFSSRLVSIGAPGQSILSTVPNFVSSSGYAFFSGTSMASPHVAGAAALVCAANPTITLAQLRGVLAYTGDVVPALQGKTTTGRRLNVGNAVQSALENDTTAPAQVGNLRVVSQNGRNITLAWTASGDDDNSGQAADYDVFFTNPATGIKNTLPTILLPAAAGTEQSVTVELPVRGFNGALQLRTYDNKGNSSDSPLSINLSANPTIDPYVVTLSGAPVVAPTSGVSLVTGDDKYVIRSLPFAFPFYGVNRTSMTISTNGTIYFSTPPRRTNGDADDVPSTIEGMQGQTMIAGLWDDLEINPTVRPGSGIFVTQSDANHIVIRWQGVTFATPRGQINFEVELRNDGTVIMRYGENTNIYPVVGISGGESDAYVVPSHTREPVSENTPFLNLTSAQTITFAPRAAAQLFSITGRVADASSAALPNVSVFLSGGLSASRITDSSGNYSFTDLAGGNYTVTPSHPNYTFAPTSINLTNLSSNQTANFTATLKTQAGPNSVKIVQTSFQLGEADGRATFMIERSGDTTGTITVDYSTVDTDTFTIGCADTVGNQGGAYARCDFAATVGRLSFAAGEINKTITVPIINDGHVEGAETFQLQLSNAVGSGTTLGTQNVSTVTIQDNDAAGAPNPIITLAPSDYSFFVRQQYLDFLSREPEPNEPWTAVMNRCANVNTGFATVTDCDRIAVSKAIFESPEFQIKGFYVFRFYKVAFDRLPQYTEIVSDMSFVAGTTEAEVYARKAQLATAFAARPEFITAYGWMNNEQYVATLMSRYGLASITTPEPATPDVTTRVTLFRSDLSNRLNAGTLTRAQVLRAVADSDEVGALEFNSAFVAMQYYGYLRRTPEPQGYQNNLLAIQSGTSRREMINGFLNSTEYRLRFGQP